MLAESGVQIVSSVLCCEDESYDFSIGAVNVASWFGVILDN